MSTDKEHGNSIPLQPAFSIWAIVIRDYCYWDYFGQAHREPGEEFPRQKKCKGPEAEMLCIRGAEGRLAWLSRGEWSRAVGQRTGPCHRKLHRLWEGSSYLL